MKKLFIVAGILAVLATFTACGDKGGGEFIAVTVLAQKEAAQAVAGDVYGVEVVVPSGQSPESYEPKMKNIARINKALVYFKMGLPVEQTGSVKALSVAAVNSHEIIRQRYLELTGKDDLKFGSGRDHHIWLSIERMKIQTDIIAEKLSELNPQKAADFTANAAAYKLRLDGLSAEINSLFEGRAKDIFMVDHPAYAYLADEFALEMVALEAEGDVIAPTVKEFIDRAKANGITEFFFSPETETAQKQSIVNDIPAAKFTRLSPLAQNYIDNYKEMAQKIAQALM